MPTPFGYCGVATIRPINESPFAVVVTGLAQGVALPLGIPPVETSSCFQAILFVAGLNATSRAIVSVPGATELRNWMIEPALLITGCWSDAGGDSKPASCTFAQTTSRPRAGSHAGSGHSTPPPAVGATTTYCWSVYGWYGTVEITYGFPSGASTPVKCSLSYGTCGTSSSPTGIGCVGYVCARASCGTGVSTTPTTGFPVCASRTKLYAFLLMWSTTSRCLPLNVIVSTSGVCMPS